MQLRKRSNIKHRWRVNEQIYAQKLRVIDETGKQVGILSKQDALSKARETGVDLIEIAPKAQPPVAKLIDFGKFRYREEKKLKKEKKANKAGELKEIRLSPFIADGDYTNRFSKIEEFINTGNKVKVVVKFKGRQMGSKKFGYRVLERILKELGEGISIDMKPKFLGRHLSMVISPTGKRKTLRQAQGDKSGNKSLPELSKRKGKLSGHGKKNKGKAKNKKVADKTIQSHKKRKSA